MPFRIFAEPSTTARASLFRVLAVSRVLVFLTIASGVMALIGWAAGISRLAAPLAAWRPMPPGSALSLLALGVAFWARIEGHRRLALGTSAGVLGLSLLALLGNYTETHAFAVLAPIPSAILLITASLGLLTSTLQQRRDLEKITLGVTGLALVALSITIAFARAIGVFDAPPGRTAPGSSVQLVISMLLFGVCFIALVWATGFDDVELPEWLPGAAGLASLITVMSLWSALAEREHTQRIDYAQQAATAATRVLARDVESGARALQRAADLAAAGVNLEQQERDFQALHRAVPALESIHRLTSDGVGTLDMPRSVSGAEIRTRWLSNTRSGRQSLDSLAYVPLDSALDRFAVYALVCDSIRGCSGVMAGVFRSSVLFAPVVTDSVSDFHFVITPLSALNVPPSPRAPSLPDAVRELSVGGLHWLVSAWPDTDREVAGSNLPGAILFMGLVVTLLLPTTLQLGRSAWEGARDREHARLSMALDRSTDGIWEVDLVTGAAKRSASLLHHLQYSSDDATPSVDEWSTLIHPDDRPMVEGALSRHLTGESDSYEAEYRVRAADGRWHLVVDRGRVVDRTPHGQPSRLLGISADVTEAREVAREREASEQRFRALFNSSFQFQILLDSDSRVLEVNRVSLEHAGTPLDDVRHALCWETLWWARNTAARATLRDACQAAANGESRLWEQEFVSPGQPPLLLDFSIKPIYSTQGNPAQLLLEGRDVTERRRAEALMTEVETLTTMGRLAARVAHEINNPLAGIQNAFLLIKDAVSPDHRYFRYVGSIEREIERISDVTRQLYETYRPERDNSRMASLKLVVTDAVAFLEQVNRSRKFSIVTDLGSVAAQVPVPAAMLRQIVYNLVQNAIDASPPDGVVSIAAVAKGDTISFHVKDQGPGIPDELKDQIFEQFFSTKGKQTKTSGMGLGLALVRRTVALAGGSIIVNTRVGHGTEFIVTLPIELHADGEDT